MHFDTLADVAQYYSLRRRLFARQSATRALLGGAEKPVDSLVDQCVRHQRARDKLVALASISHRVPVATDVATHQAPRRDGAALREGTPPAVTATTQPISSTPDMTSDLLVTDGLDAEPNAMLNTSSFNDDECAAQRVSAYLHQLALPGIGPEYVGRSRCTTNTQDTDFGDDDDDGRDRSSPSTARSSAASAEGHLPNSGGDDTTAGPDGGAGGAASDAAHSHGHPSAASGGAALVLSVAGGSVAAPSGSSGGAVLSSPYAMGPSNGVGSPWYAVRSVDALESTSADAAASSFLPLPSYHFGGDAVVLRKDLLQITCIAFAPASPTTAVSYRDGTPAGGHGSGNLFACGTQSGTTVLIDLDQAFCNATRMAPISTATTKIPLFARRDAGSAQDSVKSRLGAPSAASGANPPSSASSSSSACSSALLLGHLDAVTDIAWSTAAGSLMLLTVSADSTAIVWDARRKIKVRQTALQHQPSVVRFLPMNNNYFVVGMSTSATLRVFNLSTGMLVKKSKVKYPVTALELPASNTGGSDASDSPGGTTTHNSFGSADSVPPNPPVSAAVHTAAVSSAYPPMSPPPSSSSAAGTSNSGGPPTLGNVAFTGDVKGCITAYAIDISAESSLTKIATVDLKCHERPVTSVLSFPVGMAAMNSSLRRSSVPAARVLASTLIANTEDDVIVVVGFYISSLGMTTAYSSSLAMLLRVPNCQRTVAVRACRCADESPGYVSFATGGERRAAAPEALRLFRVSSTGGSAASVAATTAAGVAPSATAHGANCRADVIASLDLPSLNSRQSANAAKSPVSSTTPSTSSTAANNAMPRGACSVAVCCAWNASQSVLVAGTNDGAVVAWRRVVLPEAAEAAGSGFLGGGGGSAGSRSAGEESAVTMSESDGGKSSHSGAVSSLSR